LIENKLSIAEPLLEKLKKKTVKAKVEVKPYRNIYQLLKIIENS